MTVVNLTLTGNASPGSSHTNLLNTTSLSAVHGDGVCAVDLQVLVRVDGHQHDAAVSVDRLWGIVNSLMGSDIYFLVN